MTSSASARVRRFWESHPMDYDWRGRRASEPGSPEFFAEVEAAMRSDLASVHDSKGRLFGQFVDHDALRGQRVLEVGCGMGLATAAFARSGARVVAVDVTSRAATAARAVLAERNLLARGDGEGADTLVGDALALPFPGESFDRVWSWGVIHHTPSPAQAAREIVRVLRPGGRATVMVYARGSITYLLHLLLWRGVIGGALSRMSPTELQARFTDGVEHGGSPFAAHLSARELRDLFAGCRVRIERRGQMSEVFPRVHARLEQRLAGARGLAERITRHAGWFLVASVERPLRIEEPVRARRVAILSQIPAPYKSHEYRRLARDPRLNVEVIYEAADHPARGWRSERPSHAEVTSRVMSSFALLGRSTDSIRAFYLAPGVLREVLGRRQDLLVLEGWSDPTYLCAWLAARVRGTPHVVRSESHGRRRTSRGRVARAWRRLVVRPMVRGAVGWIAASRWAAEELSELGARSSDVLISPLLPDPASLEGVVARRRVAPDEPMRVAFVGRGTPEKGLDVLEAALEELQATSPGAPVELVIIGSPRRLPANEVPGTIATCDVLVAPAREEPWGMAVVEAMSVGVAVVASDAVAAAADLLADLQPHAICPVEDVPALVRSLKLMRDDPAAAARLAEAARSRVSALFESVPERLTTALIDLADRSAP